MTTRSPNGQYAKLLDSIVKIMMAALTIILGFIAWQGQTIITSINEHERRIATIESNRYTAQDGLRDQRLITGQIESLRGWVENNYPPAYLMEDIRELKKEVQNLSRKIDSMRDE